MKSIVVNTSLYARASWLNGTISDKGVIIFKKIIFTITNLKFAWGFTWVFFNKELPWFNIKKDLMILSRPEKLIDLKKEHIIEYAQLGGLEQENLDLIKLMIF